MNFISWNKAYSLYPIPTFHGNYGILTRWAASKHHELYELDKHCKLETLYDADLNNKMEATLWLPSRFVGDIHCWSFHCRPVYSILLCEMKAGQDKIWTTIVEIAGLSGVTHPAISALITVWNAVPSRVSICG